MVSRYDRFFERVDNDPKFSNKCGDNLSCSSNINRVDNVKGDYDQTYQDYHGHPNVISDSLLSIAV